VIYHNLLSCRYFIRYLDIVSWRRHVVDGRETEKGALSKRERQNRYRTTGAAANLIKVETLVPRDGRGEILRVAARLRKRARRGARAVDQPIDVAAVLRRIGKLCAVKPRRYATTPDVDNLVVTSVNVPFPHRIYAKTLVDALQSKRIPDLYVGHLERFLGETPLALLLRFCDRHGIGASELRSFIDKHRSRLALHRADLDEHLNALVSHS
jgi:hypothetical protein